MKHKLIKSAFALVGLFMTQAAMGQSLEDIQAATESGPAYQFSLATVLFIFAIILVFIAAGMLIIAVHMKRYLKGELGEEYAKRQPFWEKLFQIKPISSDKDTVINHPHDGIYELDNPPPPWFMFLFYGTILFALIYYIRFTFTDSGYTQAEEYAEEMQLAEDEKAKLLAASGGNVIDETNVELLTSESDLSKGAAIFKANCVSCHGDYGQGGIGPNFTDNYWLHGGDIKDVFSIVKNGSPNRKMQSWSKNMPPASLQAVASYVITLEGTKLPDGIIGQPAQGEPYDRNATEAATEDTSDEEATDEGATDDAASEDNTEEEAAEE